ncbi:winged helix-turn-helix transcriptional regulator, partial [Streptomyces sp. SID11233]|nr:winged helix-turn-helix transcriptional regulator [Streptomyces sp. SID11233]
MTTATPAVSPRDLALAHYAARAVLEKILARHGITFPQQITLRAAATAEAPRTPDALVAEVRGYLKTAPDAVRADLDVLLAAGLLVAEGPHLRATEAGRALLAATAAEVAPVTARVWAGIPAEDLAATARVLAQVR